MAILRTTFAGAWARKRRLVGTVGAVLLGVAFLAATLVLGDTARAGMADVLTAANAGTDVVVRSESRLEGESSVQQGLLDAGLADVVAGVEGVEVAEPTVEGIGQVLGSDGTPLGGDGPPTIATGWFADDRFNPFRLVDGRAPEADFEVVIDRATATDGDLAVGDTTTVLVPAPVEVTVVGIAAFGNDDGMAGATFVAFPRHQVGALLLGDPAAATHVFAVAEDGADAAELAERVSAALPAGVEALTGADRVAEQQQSIEEDFLGFMETFLLVFAGVALLVATSSVHNTATILVAQRTRESALLRAVGASRGQVFATTLAEAAIVGLVGAAVGTGAGIGLAAGLAAMLEAADMGLPVDQLVVTGGTVAWSIGVGLVLSLLASVVPAWKAGRVPPIAALREVALEDGRPSRWRSLAGAALAVVGIAGVVGAAETDSALATAGLGALLLIAAMVLLGPAMARPLSSVVGAPLGAAGVTGRLALGGAQRNPRRTAGTASALLVGIGVVTAFTVLADSLSSSIEEAVDGKFAGDLVVQPPGWGGAGLAPELVGEVGDLPEVDRAVPIGEGLVLADGEELDVIVSDPAGLHALFDLGDVDGDLAAVADDGMVISTRAVEEHGWGLGDRIGVTFGNGTATELRVAAVYDDRTAIGDVLLPTATWEANATQASSFLALVDLADGVDVGDGRRAIEAVAAPYGAPDVLDRDEYIESEAGEIEQILALVYGLLALAIVIAGLGIAGTLSLSIHERTRELGLLRAIGLDRRQLRAVVRGEAVLVALLGTVAGVALGVFVGWGMIRAAGAEEGLGTFTVPVGSLAVVLGLGALVGVLAAARPARRAAKRPVLDALAAT